MHHTYGQWENTSKIIIVVLYCIVLYCIVCYKYSSVVDGDHFWVYEVFGLLKVYFKVVKFVISVSKTRPFENDLFVIS